MLAATLQGRTIEAAAAAARPAQAMPGAAGLTIVVIAGEGAVNIIQQKTAVAPVVEVRDRNSQPVAGALVRFAIQGGRASFDGARAVTLVTNAAGRAAVTTLTPTASGTVEIGASASFQGQVATATIVQTNFATVAAATAAAAAAAGVATAAGGTAAGGATAGAAAGGAATGGGLSAATIGIVGGAVAGGTIVTQRVVGGGGGGPAIYEGEFRIDGVSSIRQVRGNGTVALSCTSTVSFTGEVRAEVDAPGDGSITGKFSANGYVAELLRTCPFSSSTSEKISFGSANVTGTAGSFQANGASTSTDGVGFGTLSFSGALSGGAITGTFAMSSGYRTIPDSSGFFSESSFPTTSTQVTLTK